MLPPVVRFFTVSAANPPPPLTTQNLPTTQKQKFPTIFRTLIENYMSLPLAPIPSYHRYERFHHFVMPLKPYVSEPIVHTSNNPATFYGRAADHFNNRSRSNGGWCVCLGFDLYFVGTARRKRDHFLRGGTLFHRKNHHEDLFTFLRDFKSLAKSCLLARKETQNETIFYFQGVNTLI